MWNRDYMKSTERLDCWGIKISRHLKRGLFEYFRHKKRNKNEYTPSTNSPNKSPNSENTDRRTAINISILACQPGQVFWIGQDIQITVLGSSQGIVRLGIEAPLEMNISKEFAYE